MAQYTDDEFDARDEGKTAFEEGKPRSSNPHSTLSAKNLWTCWDEGWDEAQNETDEDDKED
jgi:hypothetical protein